ncbi:MAG: sensor domain-containing diguanylate cyclase [Thermoleophilia bacterium]|nr:sensor domain-containing diguanylate cyclase [Thermoleophilia bacterium]
MASAADTAVLARAPYEVVAASYRKLADLFHEVLSERGLDQLFERLSATLAELVPCDGVVVYAVDEALGHLVAVHASGHEAAATLRDAPLPFGAGLTGWALERREPVLSNRADLDPRALTVEGTDPDLPEALIVVPLVARGALKGALNVSRLGTAGFTAAELNLVIRAADAAALAIDDAETRASLERQARTDALTGTLHTRSLQDHLRETLARAALSGTPTALVMLDVDEFKRVNDLFGHLLGDDLLVELTCVLRETARSGDEIGRLGGDEFVVVAPGADAAAARALAERLAARVKELRLPAGVVTVSIGIAVAPGHATGARELLARAETAMMAAKAQSHGGTAVFGEGATGRPTGPARTSERSLADLRLLYGLATKLVRLTEPVEIAETVVARLDRFVDLDGCVVIAGGRVLAARGERPTAHVVSIPLWSGTSTLGSIEAYRAGVERFTPGDVRLLESLAVHVAAALARAAAAEA